VKLIRAEEIPPGTTRFFRVGENPLIVANVEGEFHALYGICSHQNLPLEGAKLWDHCLDCPWHHFLWDVRTGENRYPSNVYPPDLPHLREQCRPLPRYPVEIRDGELWVDLQ
jgi:nitrite reductase/ring-hydroxylating ferredoxin subunit